MTERASPYAVAGATALVTGTSRGLGREVARLFAARGAHVICHARAEEAARAVAAPLGGTPVWGDLSRREQVDALVARVMASTDHLNVLVHNAAETTAETFDDVRWETLTRIFSTNVLAPIILTQAFAPLLRAAPWARVVVLSSSRGQFASGIQGTSLPYSVSKAAVNAFAANVARLLRRDGILINAFDPGWVRTDMGGPDAPDDPVAAAQGVISLATLPPSAPSGAFFRDGAPIPW